MNPLIIEFKPGERRAFTFVGWQPPRVAFYARDEAGNPKVVELSAPYPHDPDTGLQFEFPMVEPVEIFPADLVPPGCGASEQDIPRIGHVLGKTFLYPQPKHEALLRCALKLCHANAKKEWAEEIAKLKNMTPMGLFFYDALRAATGSSNTPRSPEAIEAERSRQAQRIEDKYRQRLNLTLDEMKRGESSFTKMLRDGVLLAVWAKETGTDLQKMNQAAEEFESQWRDIWRTEPLLENLQDDQASVKYGVRSTAGLTFYLRSVSIRNPLTTDEVGDFAKLESIQQVPKQAARDPGVEIPARGMADPRQTEQLADSHRMLSGGIMLTVGPLMDKMTPDEKLLFNLLVAKNPERPGWALSYRDIGEKLCVSQTEVQRRRKSLGRKCGRDIEIFIAEARGKNEKGLNPEHCSPGKKRNTKTPDLDD